ncbi:TetR/AcrR family transcriptional regulator [Georgenia sp. Z1344]|uniref:TetR/AcrR family transcriptional regulator n=1 Tax=Georgenia sp. Z1344 TaxID=3416706 RepID=UPI003CED2349
MARPVDPELRRARRLQLIDAGLTAFAERGAAATTADICRIAGVGSGTFFHHFATKDALVVAIVELGTEETRELFASLDDDNPEDSARAASVPGAGAGGTTRSRGAGSGHASRSSGAGASPRGTVLGFVDHAAEDLADPRASGFVRAVGALTHRPTIVAALEADERVTRELLGERMSRAQRAGAVRVDVPADRLTTWVLLLLDGFAAGVAGGQVDAGRELPMLHEQVAALLDGPAGRAPTGRT